MAQLSLFFLGPFKVQLCNQLITQFASDKVRALLAYLAVEAGQPHRRSALAGLLWPDYPERAARASLRNAMANLRQAIGDQKAKPSFLLIDRETIQFQASSDHWLDIRAFERYLSLDDQPSSDVIQQSEIENHKSAVALFRGDFLQGFSLPDSSAFDEWVLLERENLNRKVVLACSRLAGEFDAREDFEQACSYAYQLVTIEPWHEETHRQLMRLLALSGQRAAALAQYETCCRSLKEELDVEPDSETIRLSEQIRDGEIKGPVMTKPTLHNLPAMLSRFVGREGELRELKLRLEDPACRLLTVVGPGGCGKTRLAIEAARQQIDYFKHGVYLVPLVGVQSAQAIPQAIGAALSFSFRPEGEPRRQLLDYLRGKQVLLVMDNFEHLLDGMEMLIELLNRAPAVKILVTSRSRLNSLDENIFLLGGMAYPEDRISEEQALDLTSYSSARLFLEGARHVKPGYEPGEEDLEQIGAICQLVAGMPLAVLLSASWTALLGPTEIAAHIRQDSLDFLETEWQDVPRRHRSLRHLFDHSWDLLDTEAQAILAGLSVFPGSFSFQAAQAVTCLNLKALRSLVDRSMVESTSQERFKLHPLMRQYAWEKLNGYPEQKVLFQERHCVFFAEMLAWWARKMQGPGQLDAQRKITSEIGNIRLAWDLALEHVKFDCLSDALDGLGGLYERLCLYREGEYVFDKSVERMQEALENGLDESYIPLLVGVIGWQSVFNRMLGKFEIAYQAITTGFDLLESRPFQPKMLDAQKAFLYQQRGFLTFDSNRAQSQRDLQASLEIYQGLGNRWRQAPLLNCLAGIVFSQGQYRKAIALIKESLVIYRDCRDNVGIATSLIELSNKLTAFGDFERLDEFVHKHAIRLRDLGSPALFAEYIAIDGINQFYLGRYTEARERMHAAIEIYEDLGDQVNLCIHGHLLGWLDVSSGFYERGQEHYQVSMDLAHQQGNKHLIALGYLGLGELYLARGAYQQAQQNLEEGVSFYRQVTQQDEFSITLAALADAENHLGLHQLASAHFREALQIAQEIGSWQTCLFMVGRGALFAALGGDAEKGVELYALVNRYPYVENSIFWEDTVGRFIKEQASELPEEIIVAAKKRGRKRDLYETVRELSEEFAHKGQVGY